MEVSNEFPISKEEMVKRAQEVLGVSTLLKAEERENTLVMLFGNPNGNFVVWMDFFFPGQEEDAGLSFEHGSSDR